MTQIYNDPKGGKPSSVGEQFNTSYWDRRSLIEVAEEMFFSPLADVKQMPKHYGKELKVYHYVPLLDDRNKNDQGIDADGAVMLLARPSFKFSTTTLNFADNTAAAAFETAFEAVFAGSVSVAAAVATLTDTEYDATADVSEAEVAAIVAAAGNKVVVDYKYGNLYGSSKDVGTIAGKMPVIGEDSTRVNRVGFTRLERKGNIIEHGFFTEFTEDSFTFDTDSELYGHMSREMLAGANEINEDLLQIDLLNAGTTVVRGGGAPTDAQMIGHGTVSEISLDDLRRMSITLDDNRTPKKTTIIKGSKMTDTRVVPGSRVAFIGSELQMQVQDMTDSAGKAAFIPVEKYADAATILNGEIGAIPSANLRIVVVPNMMHWGGAGGVAEDDSEYLQTGGKYDIYPMLVVGDQSFATIGLQGMAGGKATKQKFKIIVKKPSKENADRNDPFGKLGFSSISFWYGFIKLRPERIAVAKTVAKM